MTIIPKPANPVLIGWSMGVLEYGSIGFWCTLTLHNSTLQHSRFHQEGELNLPIPTAEYRLTPLSQPSVYEKWKVGRRLMGVAKNLTKLLL